MTVLLWISGFLGAVIIGFLVFWRFYFLRDPHRNIPEGNVIVSPADGIILDIIDTKDKELIIPKRYMGKIKTLCSDISSSCKVISIFMSPLDVHINRMPVRGKVLSVIHKKGSFKPVNSVEAGLQNEKVELTLQASFGKIKVIQVAGIIARRIVCHAKKGDTYNTGERYGLINLGSQLIVILPGKIPLTVEKGQRVRAGESVLGKFKEKDTKSGKKGK
ncbi:MAG: phosphatidylserine decarboxylase [Candidatus Woesearchaeota archaeon]